MLVPRKEEKVSHKTDYLKEFLKGLRENICFTMMFNNSDLFR